LVSTAWRRNSIEEIWRLIRAFQNVVAAAVARFDGHIAR